MRVAFTGGSGKAGRHAIAHLVGQGHEVTNLDLVPLRHPGVPDLRVDLTDLGQCFNALSAPASGLDLDRPPATYDALVHFAAIPSMFLTADAETYRVNVLSTFNVLEAATKLGIRKLVIPTTETTYRICFARAEMRPLYTPVDEDHPTVPQDAYAMSKVVNETTARSFQARTGADIFALRINNVIEPHEYATLVPLWRDRPEVRRRNVFAYIDARDLGHMVDRCLLADGLGYQVLNVANDDSSVGLPSEEVRARFYEGVPLRRPLGEFDTFYSSERARRLVGFAPRHGWREA